MNETLYALNLLGTPLGFAMAGLIGLFFGFFLEKAGFGSSRKLTAVFYFKDMAVIKVMFTAVITALVGYHYLVSIGWVNPAGIYILETYWGAQIVGGLLFGVGFVVGGWCPGTAYVGIASGKGDALFFLVGAVLGGVLFNELYSWIEPLHTGLRGGAQFLWESLHLPRMIVILIFSVVAVAVFMACTRLEKRFGGLAGPGWEARIVHGAAGVVLIALAVGLFFVPFPEPKEETGLSVEAAPETVLSEIVAAEDHIYAMDLADMILSGKQDLMVVDIRPAETYRRFHIRTAVNIPLHRLASEGAIDLSRTGTIVLYSNGTTHAAQAWLELRHMGRRNAFVLMDGILGFWRECLTPPSLKGIIDPEAARSAQAAFRKRHTFFIEEFQAGKGDESEIKAEVFGLGETLPMQAMGLEHHLVSTEWLASRKKDGHLVIIDAREKGSLYSANHIPGALYLGVENLRTTVGGIPSMMVPPDEVALTLGRLGINLEDTVIVYADRLRDAAYIALALERVGHPSYAILHGGFQKWMDEERPQSTDIPTPKPTSYIPAEETMDFIITVDGVHQLLGDGSTVIIDVRPEAYFKGIESDEARAGHIPGAVNRPFSYDLVPQQALWKDRDLLLKAYKDLGIEKNMPVLVHCRTGHQASQTYFLLKHLLGFQNVRWMDASWAAWAARHELPIEKR